MIFAQPEGLKWKRQQGFTLTEVLLVVAVLMMVSGAAIYSLSTFKQGAVLNTGTVRFESVLRFARAAAANSGRRVRVTLMPEKSLETTNQVNQIHLSWEPKPLDEPEVFEDFPSDHWGLDQVNESVEVESVRIIDTATGEVENNETEEDLLEAAAVDEPEEMAQPSAITFNPDGSCDSAEIILAARDPEEMRRATVRIEGFTGAISHSLGLNEAEPPCEECPEQIQSMIPVESE